MSLSATTMTIAAGVNYTVTTDSSDWSVVANNTYFYDRTTKLTYFKNSGGNTIFTDIPQGNFYSQLQEGEEQTIKTALNYAKLGFEQLGYEVVIDQTV